ncbi:MAG TPA: ABC transporter ATP-binding protein [Candidatus Bipolaricaulis sp.]|nr:ABC transporter ATP-binding protein [Candidatus Bipolaricaulis sp.]HRS14238.1 ABC transporter ATP-binding protein [Candidatus Bipolaricaulis sp.]HRU21689.1 ABC transporter ATP-binding protein [Candidatus Bipolaricaulis sp.]
MTPAIELRTLTKLYGPLRALDRVSLAVPSGSVFGFLGPNGAGKTTTLRILTGLARPTSGSASVLGHDVATATNDVRAAVGYLPDVPGFYPWMTGRELLRFAGRLFGLSGSTLSSRVDALLDLAGLAGVTTRVGGYSRGMKQRLGVAQALINAPSVLLLDEPTSALDPIGRKSVLDMIASLAGRTTVFFSTHILSDVERVCDTVAILHRGVVVAQAPIGELKARYAMQKIAVEVTAGADELAQDLADAPWVASVERPSDQRLVVAVTDPSAAQRAIPAAVANRGVGLRRLETVEVSLEDVFVDLVR